MFKERGPEWQPSREQLEEDDFSRHRDKLVGFYLRAMDDEKRGIKDEDEDGRKYEKYKYIFEADSPDGRYSEKRITQVDRDKVYDMMARDEISPKIEHNLLKHIAGPRDYMDLDNIHDIIQSKEPSQRILGYLTGVPWNDYSHTSSYNVDLFLKKFPTPDKFEELSRLFLRGFAQSNVGQIVREYTDAMEDFKYTMYGKKYEYYKVMQKMHAEAKAMAPRRSYDYGDYLGKDPENYNKEPLVKDAGVAAISERQAEEAKGKFGMIPVGSARYNSIFESGLSGRGNEESQDSWYYNPEAGLFAVFDGAGGMGGAAEASRAARDTLTRIDRPDDKKSVDDICRILEEANDAVMHSGPSGNPKQHGCTTAVVGKIIDDGGKKKLIYASVGDSRIYIVRGGKVTFVTKDEGVGQFINNALGSESFHIKDNRKGEKILETGDRIVFCSDGITGDYEPDIISNDEVASVVGRAKTAEQAARDLIAISTKIDDSTAMVVEV